jgi:hypothetical protein
VTNVNETRYDRFQLHAAAEIDGVITKTIANSAEK